ncbi:hypothetical protein VP01_3597g1, partial [Puccinia sorghi]
MICQCAHSQEKDSLQVSSEDEGGAKCQNAIVKLYLFSTMDPSLKSQYQRLSQHLIAQTAYQNPNQSNGPQYAGKIMAAEVTKDPDRYCELQSHVPEQNTFIGKQFYSVLGPLFDE